MASDEEVEESFAGEDETPEEPAGDPVENDPDSEDAAPKGGEDDDDYEPEDARKKKKGKKRKARGDEKKGKKKKKKRKNDSGDESDYADDDAAGDSDYSSKKGRKRGSTKHSAPSTPAAVESNTSSGMPTIEEVCSTFGLIDVDLDYSDSDFQNLTSYKLFQQHVRPLLTKENPKVPMSKLMMLVAAKWREFSNINPNLQTESGEPSAPSTTTSEEGYSKPSRSRASKEAAQKIVEADSEPFDEEDDDDDEDDLKNKRKRSSRAKKASKKASKVPTLKIKLGKRKRGSSDEEGEGSVGGSDRDSDALVEQMLQEAEEPKSNKSAAESNSQPAEGSTEETPQPRRKAKTKIGNKSKKKKKVKGARPKTRTTSTRTTARSASKVEGSFLDNGLRLAEPKYDNRDLVGFIPFGVLFECGEIILCDTCPQGVPSRMPGARARGDPEGKWSCPRCENEGPAEQDDDEHQEFCRVCKDGGELLCCDSCTSAYHTHCLNPPSPTYPTATGSAPGAAVHLSSGKWRRS
ncbi:hypothetical protein NQ318_011624 [Aromia moschata]|uniref:Zinc finger PHD-type domain-containing protein n=1 Tax=Aromia moschata TaxID=1265417 RepID=A0AAV8Z7U9_9CUCU|nr:hypothetical protein NQ318_011624 [Aromia moschata]